MKYYTDSELIQPTTHPYNYWWTYFLFYGEMFNPEVFIKRRMLVKTRNF